MVDAVLIGTVIQKPRRSGGMSQEVLSGLAGPDRTHYSRIGRGLPSPATDTLFKISHAPDMASHEIISAVEKAQETAETTLEWNPGGHFNEPEARMAKAVRALIG